MTNPNIPVRRTGSADNERVQLNKALSGIDETLERSDEWDAAFGWGDHRQAGYQVALTETQQFENLGVPSELQVSLSTNITQNGTEENIVEISWKRILDNDIVYDLEIRKAPFGEPLANATLYSVPIVANDTDRARIVYTDSFTGDRTYFFRVRIRRDRLVSPWSAFISINVPLNLAAPPAPNLVSAEPLPASAQISWEYDYDANPTVESIKIYRNDTPIDFIARPATTFKDGVLPIGVPVTYKVRAVTYNNVVSVFSNERTTTPVDIAFGTPAVPDLLPPRVEIITNNTAGQIGRVTAEWVRIAGNNITYDLEIERRDFNTGAVLGILETPAISNPSSGNPHYEWIGNINERFAVRVRSRNATAVSAFTAFQVVDVIPDANSPGNIDRNSVVVTPLYQGALIQWAIPPADNYFQTRIDRRQVAPPEKATTEFTTIGRVSRPISFFFDDVGELTVDSNKVEGSITIRSASPPSQRPDSEPLEVGDIWIDTSDNDISRSWSGSAWEPTYFVRERFQYRLTPISSAGQKGNTTPAANEAPIEVTPSNIPEGSITAAQIIARSITADRIESNTITAGEINVGSLTADSAFIGGVQQNSILNLIIRSDTEPQKRPDQSDLKVGDIWINTAVNQGERPHTWSGTAWIRAYTAITGGDLVTGTITANEINITQVTPFIIDEGNLTGQNEVNVTIRVAVPPNPIPSQRPSGGPIRAGDVWINTADGDRPHTYDGRSPYSNDGWIRAYTSITGGDIVTGTIKANNIDVNDLVAQGQILVTNANISRLNNDTGYTDRSQVSVTIRSTTAPAANNGRPDQTPLQVGDVWINTATNQGDRPSTWNGTAWVPAYTVIDGGNITTGTINASLVAVTNIVADNIATGTLNVDRIENGSLGAIKFGNTIQSADYNQGVSGWAITTGFDPNFQFGVAEFQNLVARGTMRSGTFTSGSVGWEINNDGSAEFNNVTARGSLIAGPQSTTTRRVEITPATGTDYVIWAGANAKDDDGIFWVKADGTAKINKSVFDIGAVPNKGVASGSLTSGITNTSNAVIAEFSSFTSNGQPVLFEAVFTYFALNNESDPAFCDVLDATSGSLVLQRKVGAGSYTTITSASFVIPSSTFLFTDPDPFIDDICRVNTQGEAVRSLLDASPPAEGTANVQYRIIIGSWQCALLGSYSITGVVDTNTINASFTQ